MKIAIITIQNANNYGAVFQAYALQFIVSLKGSVKIINYENRHISRSFDLIRFKASLHGVLGFGKDIFRIIPRKVVISKFKFFINNRFNLTFSINDVNISSKDWEEFDVFISGSDQIWNPDCISDNSTINPIYFLNFAPKRSRKISYASSVGAYKFNEIEITKLKALLEDFSYISVREKDTKDFLSKVLNRDVFHVLDPTLLLNKNQWLELLTDNNNYYQEEEYILLYTVPKVSLIREAVKYFSKKIGLRVISLEQGLNAGAKVDKQYRDAGPEDFLSLFNKASFVITDSFHGVCFSVNFEKPFVAISPGKNVNRMESLLSAIGLENRIAHEKIDFEQISTNMSFALASKKLQLLRNASLNYLDKAINVDQFH
jgi:hypothetical protein